MHFFQSGTHQQITYAADWLLILPGEDLSMIVFKQLRQV